MPKPRQPVLPDLDGDAAARAQTAAQAEAHGDDGPRDALRPIGPARLRALREAIRSGRYPTDDDVLGGLERMLDPRRTRRPE
jgi:hypothetical protein